MYLPLDINDIDVVQRHDQKAIVTRNENKMHILNARGFVACKPLLNSSGEGSFWKVTRDTSSIDGWLYLGIIGNLNASNNYNDSYDDLTSYGWTSDSRSYHAGKIRYGDSGWTGFIQGEYLYFHLISNTLEMFSVQKNRKFSIDISTPLDGYYITMSTFFILVVNLHLNHSTKKNVQNSFKTE